MADVLKITVGVLVLIGVYLFLVNAKGATSIFTSAGNFINTETATLQGR